MSNKTKECHFRLDDLTEKRLNDLVKQERVEKQTTSRKAVSKSSVIVDSIHFRWKNKKFK